MKPDYEKRQVLLSRLEPVAPSWAAAIARWDSPHSKGKLPGDLQEAWTHRYLDQVLTNILAADFDDLQQKLDETNLKLQQVTAQYIEKKSWRAQLERTGLKQQQALNGWLALHKKMGRGTGKQVGKEIFLLQWQDDGRRLILPENLAERPVIFPFKPWSARQE